MGLRQPDSLFLCIGTAPKLITCRPRFTFLEFRDDGTIVVEQCEAYTDHDRVLK